VWLGRTIATTTAASMMIRPTATHTYRAGVTSSIVRRRLYLGIRAQRAGRMGRRGPPRERGGRSPELRLSPRLR
jgi:hypothetical protein